MIKLGEIIYAALIINEPYFTIRKLCAVMDAQNLRVGSLRGGIKALIRMHF